MPICLAAAQTCSAPTASQLGQQHLMVRPACSFAPDVGRAAPEGTATLRRRPALRRETTRHAIGSAKCQLRTDRRESHQIRAAGYWLACGRHPGCEAFHWRSTRSCY